MGQPVADKLVYGAHQLTMQDMADATTAPLLASPADNLERFMKGEPLQNIVRL